MPGESSPALFSEDHQSPSKKNICTFLHGSSLIIHHQSPKARTKALVSQSHASVLNICSSSFSSCRCDLCPQRVRVCSFSCLSFSTLPSSLTQSMLCKLCRSRVHDEAVFLPNKSTRACLLQRVAHNNHSRPGMEPAASTPSRLPSPHLLFLYLRPRNSCTRKACSCG